jgi:hypothetical protein
MSSKPRSKRALRRTARGLGRVSRRGVASVLAMMFLILFGSLIAAMAVSSTGNIRTASIHLHVMRAMSAAETGLMLAEHRLVEASSRFIVAESDIDGAFTQALWAGNADMIGQHEVLPPPSGHAEAALPGGIAEALVNIYAEDENIVTDLGFLDAPKVAGGPGGLSASLYASESWVYTPAIMLTGWDDEDGNPPPAFTIRYAPLVGGEYIRIIAEGIVFDLQRNQQPIRRTITRDYRLAKRVDQAIISHARIMIGKNVLVEGDLGARYEQVDFDNGDPLIVRSDFYGLDPVLDQKLELLWDALTTYDVDRDNRLRVGHPVEGQGVPEDDDFDGDGSNDGAFADVTGDGFLDEFDIFIRHYDTDNDGRVTLSTALTAGTPAEGRTPEFVGPSGEPIDEDLALLIDAMRPDRNRNGVHGWNDANRNGLIDNGELPNDYDPVLNIYRDRELGWRDGFIDAMDQYAKVTGGLRFTVTAAEWESARGPLSERLQGPIRPRPDEPPMVFGADNSTLPSITADSFADTENALIAAADGQNFWQQVADQLGVAIDDLATFDVALNPGGSDAPHFRAVWPDANFDGLPDNQAWAYFENSPFNSPSYSDVYWRPVFRNFVFRNVQIPMGLNALFENCTFVGSTYVRAHTINTHAMWTELGTNTIDGAGRPIPKHPRYVYGDDGSETEANAPDSLPDSARPPQEFVLMTLSSISPLDKGDVPMDEIVSYGASYSLLPDPLIVNGKRITDTKLLSNNLRFHDSLFVGSIVADTPVNYTQVRNKIQFTGATRFSTEHPDEPENSFLNPDAADLPDILSSSMMLPNYSVDIGTFNSPQGQDVRLQGAIIAGVLDVRGNTEIVGTLLLTFAPEQGQAPLVDAFGNPVGNPAGFNASLGYFGPDDGDFESVNPNQLPVVDGVRIVGWDTNDDGLADVRFDDTPPDGAVPVPFNGYGRIRLRHDPRIRLPSGLMLPLDAVPVPGTYQEGSI